MSGDDTPAPPAELTEDARWRLVDAGIVGEYEPSVNCPHPDGSPEAEQWWRDEWKKATAWAYAHGDLDAALDDAGPVVLPPYPVHALPQVMRDVAETIAANKCVPVDLAANLLFALLSMLASPRFVIDRGKDWLEPLIVWTLSILDASERKSPAFGVVAGIVAQLEEHVAAEHRQQVRDEIDALRQQAAKLKEGGAAVNKPVGEQIKALESRIEGLEEDPPKPPKLRIGAGTTSEAIERAMGRSGGHVAIFDDESAVFGNVSGIYNSGIPTGLDTVLKGYDGTSVPANERIKRETEPIGRACLTLGITCQPRPVIDSFRVPQLRERGFHSRWSYSIPDPVPELVDPPELDRQAIDRFTGLLRNVLAHPVINPSTPADQWPAIRLSPEARKLHQELQQEIIDLRSKESGEYAHMTDWLNKFVGRVLRYAGLLHVAAGHGRNTPLGEETMRAACDIGRYLMPHANEVFRRAPKEQRRRDEDQAAPTAQFRVEQWVKKKRRTHFTTRDVNQTVKRQSWCHGIAQVESALANLSRDWVVRQVPRRDAAGRAMPANPWWVTNPRLVFDDSTD